VRGDIMKLTLLNLFENNSNKNKPVSNNAELLQHKLKDAESIILFVRFKSNETEDRRIVDAKKILFSEPTWLNDYFQMCVAAFELENPKLEENEIKNNKLLFINYLKS